MDLITEELGPVKLIFDTFATTETPQELIGVKVVLVGSELSGKSGLLRKTIHDNYSDKYTPRYMQPFYLEKNILGFRAGISLFDTYRDDKLRAMEIGRSDIVLICYNVMDPDSFQQVEVWRQEVSNLAPNIIVVLVATHIDLRSEARGIQDDEGLMLAKKLNASYVAISSKTMSYEQLFELVFLPPLIAYFRPMSGESTTRTKQCGVM